MSLVPSPTWECARTPEFRTPYAREVADRTKSCPKSGGSARPWPGGPPPRPYPRRPGICGRATLKAYSWRRGISHRTTATRRSSGYPLRRRPESEGRADASAVSETQAKTISKTHRESSAINGGLDRLRGLHARGHRQDAVGEDAPTGRPQVRPGHRTLRGIDSRLRPRSGPILGARRWSAIRSSQLRPAGDRPGLDFR